MMPMSTGVTEADFVGGKWSRAATPTDLETQKRMKKARSLLWKELGEYKIWACKSIICKSSYFDTEKLSTYSVYVYMYR